MLFDLSFFLEKKEKQKYTIINKVITNEVILKLNIKSPINILITMVIEERIIKDLSMTLTVDGILFAIVLSIAELFD